MSNEKVNGPEPHPGHDQDTGNTTGRALHGAELMGAAVALAVAAVALFAYGPSLRGGFVHEDRPRIQLNPTLLDNTRLRQALTAGEAPPGADASDRREWRPATLLWRAANARVFGTEDAAGWRLVALALHLSAALLAYALLRALGSSPPVSAAATLLFVAHPALVGAVAWPSGSAVALMGALSLASLLAFVVAWRGNSRRALLVAALLYLAAMLTSPAAAFLPLAALAVTVAVPGGAAGSPGRKAAAALAPFLAMAVAYLAGRLAAVALGGLWPSPPDPLTPAQAYLTVPKALVFYLQHILAPWPLSPVYDVAPVGPGGVTGVSFLVPVVVSLVAVALMTLIALQTAAGRLGLGVFAAFMVPALALAPRPASRFLTDNALYLPVLALAMVLVPGLTQIARARVPRWRGRLDWAALGVAAVVAVALALGSRTYSRAWASDLGLWVHATEVAPGSAYAWTRAGVAAHRARENFPARRYLQRAIELQPTADAYLAAAEVALDTGRPSDAIDVMNLLVAVQPDNAGAYERLALAYQAQRDFDAAAQALEDGIAAAPSRRCAFTTNLGVVRYLQGDKEAARQELEAARGLVDQEDNPICLLSLFHLGQLYHELERDADAKVAIEEYLARSEALRDDVTRADRAAAMQLLGQLAP